MRSPIEMMVDRVCGFDRSAPGQEPKKEKTIDEETKIVLDACNALAAWVAAVDSGNTNDAQIKKIEVLEAGRALLKGGW